MTGGQEEINRFNVGFVRLIARHGRNEGGRSLGKEKVMAKSWM